MINELNSDYKNKLLNRFDDSFKNIVDNLVEINVKYYNFNNEISNDDNVSQSQMANYAVSTPAKKEIYDFSTNLISFIENYYINNISQAEAVLQAVNMDIYSNIAQISIMIKTGNIT